MTTKDLTKELFFDKSDATTIDGVKELFRYLFELDWTIDIYRHKSAKTFNLSQLGWSIGFNSRKKSAGICKVRWRRNALGDKELYAKRIELSMHFLTQNLEEGKATEWEEVIRHELAHAIDFELRKKSNHDRHWKAVANTMLSSGRVTFTSDELKDQKMSKYTLKCVEEGCDYKRPSHKKRKENARSHPCCTTCYNEGKGYKRLVQVQNY